MRHVGRKPHSLHAHQRFELVLILHRQSRLPAARGPARWARRACWSCARGCRGRPRRLRASCTRHQSAAQSAAEWRPAAHGTALRCGTLQIRRRFTHKLHSCTACAALSSLERNLQPSLQELSILSQDGGDCWATVAVAFEHVLSIHGRHQKAVKACTWWRNHRFAKTVAWACREQGNDRV